ncbi:MAG: cytochrome c [Ahniella sp.]|nr:cytochrome c [Ahniella sp.]
MLLLALLVAGTAGSVQAQTAGAQGDAAAGKKKFYTCTGCHGIAGYRNAYPDYPVPKLAGQNEGYIVNAMNAYKAGERKHPTMRAQAESLSAQDVADIATYLSNVK